MTESNEKMLQPELTLTFDPFSEPAPQMQTAQPEPPAVQEQPKPAFDESMLTEQERQMVNNFAAQIDLSNSSVILQYGAGAQKKMADFSESALENVRTKDLGEIGQMLTGVVTELKNFEEEDKGFFGFFKKNTNKLNTMKAKYAKAETNINQIVQGLENQMVVLLKDVAMLDKMYEINKTYFKELSMYILAGQKKLAEVRSTQLAELVERARRTARFGIDPHDLHSDGSAAAPGAEQRHADDRKDSVHHCQHHPAVEKPDGFGAGCHPFPAGSTGTAAGHRYDQRTAAQKCTDLKDGNHRNC